VDVKGQKGYALISVLFIVSILLIIGTGILNITTTDAMMGKYFEDYTAAWYLAEAGLQKTLTMLKKNPDYSSPRWKAFLRKTHILGRGKYKVTISPVGVDTIKIDSVGKVNKAETSILAKVKVIVRYIEDEENPDIKERIVRIIVQSWAHDGPI